ncbi:FAD-dependent monooxygenase [Natronosporangium hydrolyticum]|uniref:FAD-dependent monooxygenase n=1 Tax=Natronosporangium hydrolyticum TaxID=2811111 RepID=A0A895YM42_9ACTN|nr:NAD(P)/FAD-dependent oxidoreductase [Natronosporangium hydrolyticum]QSB16383.1 FAD-dependent monooxygenase [Natronosporangium hydrolyticum]
MASTRSAVVVGAGIAGLAVAGALAGTGWRVTLLERQDRLRAAPTAMLLWPSGVQALQALGLASGLDAIATPVPDRGLRRPDGRWLVEPDPASDRGSAQLVHAEDLHDALVAGLSDRVELRTGVRVRGVAPGATAAVTDGDQTWGADLVVAADGVDSVLRERVAPRCRTVSAGATAWRAMIPWFRAPELPPDLAAGGLTISAGGPATGGYQFFMASLGRRGAAGAGSRGGRYWRATVVGAPRPEPPETQLTLLRRWFAGWHEPVGELLAATEPGDLVQQELRTVHPMPPRYATALGAGALALLGDAGHSLPEHLGFGGCLALEDAATLVAKVQGAAPGAPLQTAVAAYSAARRPRLAQVQRRSRRLAATGPVARLGLVQARRRDQAVAATTSWQPPMAADPS